MFQRWRLSTIILHGDCALVVLVQDIADDIVALGFKKHLCTRFMVSLASTSSASVLRHSMVCFQDINIMKQLPFAYVAAHVLMHGK